MPISANDKLVVYCYLTMFLLDKNVFFVSCRSAILNSNWDCPDLKKIAVPFHWFKSGPFVDNLDLNIVVSDLT